MKKLLSIALALSTLSVPALARDHWGGDDRGYGRGAYGENRGYDQRGYDRGGSDRGHGYGYVPAQRGYYAGGGYYGGGRQYGYRDSCRGSNVNGTILGAIAGGVIGNATSSPYDRGRGTVIGGLLGGVVGNRIDASTGRCRY